MKIIFAADLIGIISDGSIRQEVDGIFNGFICFGQLVF
jgi:hypothetical protein